MLRRDGLQEELGVDEATRKAVEAPGAENAAPKEENAGLRAAYRELYEAAERVSAAALKPGICEPTRRGESGERRMIVATRPLDRLDEVLWG